MALAFGVCGLWGLGEGSIRALQGYRGPIKVL